MTKINKTINKTETFNIFAEEIKNTGKTSQEVMLMSVAHIRNLVGKESKGLTYSFISNMKEHQIKIMKRDELQSVADWIIPHILTQYPKAEIKILREGSFQIYIDGLPKDLQKEIE